MTGQNETPAPEPQDQAVPTDGQPERAKKSGRWGKVTGFSIGALILGIIIGSAGGSGDTPTAAHAARPQPKVTVTVTARVKEPRPGPTVTQYVDRTVTPKPVKKVTARPPAPKKPKPAADGDEPATAGQANAVGTAKDYLGYTHFSRSGLISQLKFEGYTTAEATYAVDHVTVDWNEQAAGTAKDYLGYSHFSRAGLIQQLEFDGYTTAQATYGVDHAGL